MTVKQQLLKLAKDPPKECILDEALYRIYVRKQIEAGLKDEAEGRLVSHEKVFAKYANDGRTISRS